MHFQPMVFLFLRVDGGKITASIGPEGNVMTERGGLFVAKGRAKHQIVANFAWIFFPPILTASLPPTFIYFVES